MRKYSPDSGDPYLDPDTGILRNLVGAITEERLELLEGTLVSARAYELALDPEAGSFDLAHLQRFHRRLFQDVYEWAGQLRIVEITKGSTIFARRDAIERAAATLFEQLGHEHHLRGLDPMLFSARAGYFLGEINVLHPFRDGNGRTQRAFVGQLAEVSGYRINWDAMAREDVVRASIAAYNGNSIPMAQLVENSLSDFSR